MATITTRIKDARQGFARAQEIAELAQASLTSITFDFTANDVVIVYNNASTSSPDTLRSHNKGVLDTAYASLAAEQAGGAQPDTTDNRVIHLTSAPDTPVDGDVWFTVSGVYAQVNGSTVQLG